MMMFRKDNLEIHITASERLVNEVISKVNGEGILNYVTRVMSSVLRLCL